MNDGLEYVYVWDHPEDFFSRKYYRHGYYNAKPHFVTEEGDAHLYHFVEGLGLEWNYLDTEGIGGEGIQH